MSYLDLNLKARDDWEKRFPKVSRARAIRRFVGATLLLGLIVLLGALLAGVLGAHRGQPAPRRLWYVLLPTIAVVMFATSGVVQTASAFSHASSSDARRQGRACNGSLGCRARDGQTRRRFWNIAPRIADPAANTVPPLAVALKG